MGPVQNDWAGKLLTMARLFPKRFRKQLKNFRILAKGQGQYRTIKEERIVDNQGNPIPWYTYGAIEYLNCFDFKRRHVFEFGSGYSSYYWADKAQAVVSVESDAVWYEKVRADKRANQTILLAAGQKAYVGSLVEQGRRFDIVVVDGLWRERCAWEAAQHLSEGGLIIFDNSDAYPNTAGMLRGRGFLQVDFNGFGAFNSYCWATSLFFKFPNDLQVGFRNPSPIGGRTYPPDASLGG